MIKWGICLLLSSFLLAGCETSETLEVLAPKGAPGIALASSVYDIDNVALSTTEGSDVLVAELAKEALAYDLIVAPINLGVKLMNENSDYTLNGIITWGNLYLVGTGTNQNIAAFGKGSVPQLILDFYLADSDASVEYFNAASDAAGVLLSGQYDTALLAEPLASQIIAKAKKQNIELSKQVDLQEVYENAHPGSEGYPQAAIFVKKGSEAKVEKILAELANLQRDEAPDNLVDALEVYPNAMSGDNVQLNIDAWPAQNIEYCSAIDCLDVINEFLTYYELNVSEEMISD